MSDAKKILLADDEWHLRLMISTLIKEMGLIVVGEAANGEEAIALFRETRPDLVLMDVNMPIKTGDEALREILVEFPDARVIMLTSVADMETVEACLDAGAFNYIRKDCPLDEIRVAVTEALEAD